MAFFSRTRVATLGVAALILGCGHLAFEEIPNSEAPGVDAGDERPPVEVIDAAGGTDASMVDAGCVGPSCPGTYVSGTTGSDTNPGTGAAPVKTIGQAMKIAVALGGSQKVYVAAAHYPEKITLVEKVDLLGGYECKATPCTWTRDIAMNDTVINNTDYEGVLALKTITRQTLFEGLQVVGRPGAPDAGLGSVGVTLNGGSPTIRRCRIAGADTTGGIPNAKRSIGVELIAPSNSTEGALLDRNSISAGSATNDSIGILFDNRPAAPPLSVAVATVTNNTIRGGAAPFTSGVVAWNSGAATLLRGNDITGGTSGGGSANDSSWGIAVN